MSNHLFDSLCTAHSAEKRLFVRSTDGRRCSYAALPAKTARLAQVLSSLGVKQGDTILGQAEKPIEAILLCLAVVRCGGVFVPLNPAYTSSEIASFVSEAEPALIVCDPARQADFARLETGARLETLGNGGGGTLMALAERQPSEFDDVPRGARELAALRYLPRNAMGKVEKARPRETYKTVFTGNRTEA